VKVGIDENCGPTVYRTIDAFWRNTGDQIVYLPMSYGHGIEDPPMIEAFVAGNGSLLASGDVRLLSHPVNLKAILGTGLIVVTLPNRWAQKTGGWKTAFVVRWWAQIIDHARTARRPSGWRLEAGWEKFALKQASLAASGRRRTRSRRLPHD